MPCHKRVGHQTWKLGSHQAQAGQSTGEVMAGSDSTVAETGLDRVPGPDKQLVELKRMKFPAVRRLSIHHAVLPRNGFGVLAVFSSEYSRWPGPHIWGCQ